MTRTPHPRSSHDCDAGALEEGGSAWRVAIFDEGSPPGKEDTAYQSLQASTACALASPRPPASHTRQTESPKSTSASQGSCPSARANSPSQRHCREAMRARQQRSPPRRPPAAPPRARGPPAAHSAAARPAHPAPPPPPPLPSPRPPPLRRPSSHTAAATVLLNPPREGVVEPQVLAAALGLGLGLRPDRARWRSRAGDLPYISPISPLYLAGPRGGAACGECHLPLM